MSDGTGYAPKSPDLSSFYSADPTPLQPYHQQQHQPPPPSPSYFASPGQPQPFHPVRSGSYSYRPPSAAEAPSPSAYSPPVGGIYPGGGAAAGGIPQSPQQYSSYSPPVVQQNYQPAPSPIQQSYGLQSPSAQLHQTHQTSHYQPTYGDTGTSPQVYKQSSYFPPQPPTYQQQAQGNALSASNPFPHPGPPQQQPPTSYSTNPEDLEGTMPPRKSAAAAAAGPSKPEIEPSPVRTKFPTARIKRIMQADEEVGKVAQQTPIAVGKALELFMVALVSKSADVAREKNSKRVTAQMLKHVVESDDQWDFLRDIVSKVSETEEKSKGRASAAKNESDSDDDGGAAAAKKKGRPGRKKKA